MIEKYRNTFLFGIILLALCFRLYGLNWDNGYHLHPDERAIVLSVVNLKLPIGISEFFSTESTWNPKFFAYGSFPFYLLNIAGEGMGFFFLSFFAEYSGINLVGRIISSLFDIGTLLILYTLGRRFFTTAIGLGAAFFYTLSVLPIQLSHFYAVDTILTFFITAVIYYCIVLEDKRSIKKAVLCGACFGLALATKISAIILFFPITIALLYIVINKKSGNTNSLQHAVIRTVRLLVVILLTAGIVFIITEPYALIDFPNFLRETKMQSEMTKDAFVFPYTLQYVLKVPYVHELKNIFLFGLGPLLATLSFVGVFLLLFRTVKEKNYENQARNLIILSFFIVYFLIVGSFKIGFMRYMLPLYPLLSLFAAIFVYQIYVFLKKRAPSLVLSISYLLLAISLFVWPLSFMNIYNSPNTRVQATNWILQNIPPGTGIAIEHWDDALPLANASRYIIYTLPLYDPETNEKWQQINTSLRGSDFIVIASNRLYTPLMKLTDCKNLPEGRCYEKTYAYYEHLFSGNGDFQKVAEFSEYPTFEIGNLKLEINDESADESFTVYDHPKVMIFQRKML